MQNKSIENFIKKIPKAELHIHVEGTFEPELIFKIAKRNSIPLREKSAKELKKAYKFKNLQEFLDIYYQGASVLIYEKDFYDLMMSYLKKAHSENILHAEIFFDPQTHLNHKVKFSTIVNGLTYAMNDAKKKFGISSKLILCFQRDLPQTGAIKLIDLASKNKKIIGVGLDSAEVGNPPSKFKTLFNYAKKKGLLAVAHAGEEGSSKFVYQAIKLLKVSRIDHGNHSLDDPKLIKEIVEKKIPLTLCPLSNLKLKVISKMEKHPLKIMLDKGVVVTINSDDPAYFGGYLNDNYLAVQKALNLNKNEIYVLAKNSFESSFISKSMKKKFVKKLDEFMVKNI
jgi:adenine deaminase